MSRVQVNAEAWPIVVYTLEGIASPGEFKEYLRAKSAPLSKRQPFVYVIDATRAGVTPADQREQEAAWIRDNIGKLERYSLGTAFVSRSPVFRFVLSTIFVIQPLPTAHAVCSTLDEAMRWARGRLRNREFSRGTGRFSATSA